MNYSDKIGAPSAERAPRHTIPELFDPAKFDGIKNDFDQSRFLNLYGLYLDDPIVTCRRAELLVYLEDTSQAQDLVRDITHRLADAVRVKCFIHEHKLEQVEETLSRYSLDEIPSEPLEVEGFIHLLEASAFMDYNSKRFLQAFQTIVKAETLAKQMRLEARAGTLVSHKVLIAKELGVDLSGEISRVSGNPKLTKHQTKVKLMLALHSERYNEARELAAPLGFSDTLEAYLAHLSGTHSVLKRFPDSDLLKMFFKLLELSMFAKGEIKAFSTERFKKLYRACQLSENDLNDLARLLPLGVLLTTYLELDLERYRKTIPLLRHDSDHDGIYVGTEQVCNVTKTVRAMLFRRDLGVPYYEPYRKALTRYHKALDAARLKERDFVTESALYVGLKRLGRDYALSEGLKKFVCERCGGISENARACKCDQSNTVI